jgi:hypothetical protein
MICTVKLNEEKSKHIGLVWFGSGNWFFSFTIIIAYFAVAGEHIATACTCRKECNK